MSGRRVTVRLTTEEAESIKKLAAAAGVPQSVFVRSAALDAARLYQSKPAESESATRQDIAALFVAVSLLAGHPDVTKKLQATAARIAAGGPAFIKG